MAKDFRSGFKVDGFANFWASPPLEFMKLIISMVQHLNGTALRGLEKKNTRNAKEIC